MGVRVHRYVCTPKNHRGATLLPTRARRQFLATAPPVRSLTCIVLLCMHAPFAPRRSFTRSTVSPADTPALLLIMEDYACEHDEQSSLKFR